MRSGQLASLLLVTAMVFSGCRGTDEEAQKGSTASNGEATGIPSGTNLDVALDQELNLTDVEPGASFTAKVSTPVLREGQTLIPTGAPVRGSIAKIEELPSSEGTTVLSLDFREVEVNGLVHPLHASVIAVQAAIHPEDGEAAKMVPTGSKEGEDTSPAASQPQGTEAISEKTASNQTMTPESSAPTETAETASAAKEISLGSVVTLPPQGNMTSGIQGNTGIVMKTKDGVATLPAGAVIQLRLDESLELAGTKTY